MTDTFNVNDMNSLMNTIRSDFQADETFKANVQALANRQQGEKLYRNKEGQLKTIKGFRHVIYFFQNLFTRGAARKEVQNEIAKIVNLLGSKGLANQSPDEIRENAAIIYKFLTSTRMKTMSQKIFDRSKIQKPVFKAMSQQLRHLKDRKIVLRQLPSTTERKEQIALLRYEMSKEKIALAQSIGVDLIVNGTGFTGSYRGKSTYRSIASIKPVDEDQDAKNAPLKAKIKSCFFGCLGIKRRTNLTPGEGVYAEIGAYKASKWMGIDTVPLTVKTSITSKAFKGKEKTKDVSFQQWIKNGVLAGEFKDWGKVTKENFQNTFEDFVLLDIAIGGLDTHEMNWMICGEGSEGNPYQIQAFDNGLSMGHEHPSDRFALRNMYKWKDRQLVAPQLFPNEYPANWPFSGHSLLKIDEIKANLPQMCADLRRHYAEREPGVASAKIEKMLERLEAWAFYVRQAHNPALSAQEQAEYTPAKFAAEMRTPKDFAAFFKKHPECNEIRKAARVL